MCVRALVVSVGMMSSHAFFTFAKRTQEIAYKGGCPADAWAATKSRLLFPDDPPTETQLQQEAAEALARRPSDVEMAGFDDNEEFNG